jgi:hypothetical protein
MTLPIVLALWLLLWNGFSNDIDMRVDKNDYQTGSIVLVEMFTSLGCGNCYKAEETIDKINRLKRDKDISVFPIVYHVDYWNKKSFADIFSKEKFTERQYEYARILKMKSVFTPQLVVNGSYWASAREYDECLNKIEKGLENSKNFRSIKAKYIRDDTQIKIKYALDKPYFGLINIVICQNSDSVSIPVALNQSNTIKCNNIVRDFLSKNIISQKGGEIILPLIPGLKDSNTTIIIFLQDKVSMAIEGISIIQPSLLASKMN